MKRKTNTLDAEYKRRNLVRPNQFFTNLGYWGLSPVGKSEVHDARRLGDVVTFEWKGTSVWGVKSS